MTIDSSDLVQVANHNFLKFFYKNVGSHEEGKKLLVELRKFNKKNKFNMRKDISESLLNFKLFRVSRDLDDTDHMKGIDLARRIASGK